MKFRLKIRVSISKEPCDRFGKKSVFFVTLRNRLHITLLEMVCEGTKMVLQKRKYESVREWVKNKREIKSPKLIGNFEKKAF